HRRVHYDRPGRGVHGGALLGATASPVVHRGSSAFIGSAGSKSAARTAMVMHLNKAWSNHRAIPPGSSRCIIVSRIIGVDDCVNNAINQSQRSRAWRIHTVIKQPRDIAVKEISRHLVV